jgi:methylated-DNA-[protein]-cysteine S-methyltransferase
MPVDCRICIPVDCRKLLILESQLGYLGLLFEGSTVVHLSFGHRSRAAVRDAVSRRMDGHQQYPAAKNSGSAISRLADRLRHYAAGGIEDFSDIRIDLAHLSGFSLRVAQLCREVPYGETISYGELARRAGSAGGGRAVGRVMAQNRLPLLVPCHRVVAADGRLGGFSAPGKTVTKRRLLAMEAAAVGHPGCWPSDG